MRLSQQKHIIKWEEELNNQNIEWKYIFSLPYKITICTKLRAFQYKYLMRIIPNNSFLFKCKIKPSNLCEFCHMTIDSNKHMFWECINIQSFWSNINELLHTNILDYTVNLTYECKSFCNAKVPCKKKTVIISFIILLAKYFILKCKSETTIPTIVHFNAYLKRTINIEKTIASMRDKLDKFHSKWNDYIQ